MKKLMLSLLTAAGLAAGGAAFAQDAECQAGIAWGPKPGCGDPTAPPPAPPNATVLSGPIAAPYYDPRFGYYDPRVYPPGAHAYPYVVPRVVQPSRRDRDGDGVRNRDDRYPNDAWRY
jgi:hypothetical protein